jgi:hypothetical protein
LVTLPASVTTIRGEPVRFDTAVSDTPKRTSPPSRSRAEARSVNTSFWGWIERTYHRRRRQRRLGRLTPIEFETLTQAVHAA